MNDRPTGPKEHAKTGWRIGDRPAALVLAAATIAGLFVCALLVAPFVGALTWAVALALLFAPLQARIEAGLTHRSIAAFVTVLIVAIVVALPLTFVMERLIAEAAAGAESIRARFVSGDVERMVEFHPVIAPIAKWIEEQIGFPTIFGGLATWLSDTGASFARGSVAQAIEVVVTFYLLFYLLRDRQKAAHLLRDWSPLTAAETERLFARVSDTVRATVYGTLAVAVIQGSLGGLMFWLLGLPTPLFWGVVMTLLSVVPVLGAFVIWIPAAVLLALDGSYVKAIVLAAWGAFVVGGIDNLLRPMLVGNRLKLHTVILFVSLVGGVIVFGAPGLILGPLAVSVTILLIEIWRERGKLGPPTDRSPPAALRKERAIDT
jgi:predicted PurR-regulated permease PerM